LAGKAENPELQKTLGSQLQQADPTSEMVAKAEGMA
jgi:hypothetical protein